MSISFAHFDDFSAARISQTLKRTLSYGIIGSSRLPGMHAGCEGIRYMTRKEFFSMAGASKAVVTVLGFDRKGIIAKVSHVLFERGINILDISQTILNGYFNMVMIVDISEPTCPFDELQADLSRLGGALGVQIRIQKNEIFEAMHQI